MRGGARGREARLLGRRAQARGDELLVVVWREVTDPRGVGGLVGVDLLRERVAPLGDDGVHVGEGTVDLVPLLHAGLLDLHEHTPARGLGPTLGHLQLRDHGPAREHRVCGPGARGQRRAVCLLAVQDRRFQEEPDHGRPVL